MSGYVAWSLSLAASLKDVPKEYGDWFRDQLSQAAKLVGDTRLASWSSTSTPPDAEARLRDSN